MTQIHILKSSEVLNRETIETNISELENLTNQEVPLDYREFLLSCDGGYPYPNYFIPKVPLHVYPECADGIFLSVFYDSKKILSHIRREVYGEGTPPGYIFIGNDAGGFEFLLSLNSDSYGAIFAWSHSTNTWGTDGNDNSGLFRQSDNFKGFVDTLSDTDDKDGLEFIGGNSELERAKAVSVGE